MIWGRRPSPVPSVLTASSPTAGPGEGADVVCEDLEQLAQSVADGAHPVWVGHPDLRPVVSDGVRVSTRGRAVVTAVGSAQVWMLERGYVEAYDDARVVATGAGSVVCAGRAQVEAAGWVKVVVAPLEGLERPDTGGSEQALDVVVTLSQGAWLAGRPRATRVQARGSSAVLVDGADADVEVTLQDDATCSIATGLRSRVEVVASDRALVAAAGGDVTLTGSARLMLDLLPDGAPAPRVAVRDAVDVVVVPEPGAEPAVGSLSGSGVQVHPSSFMDDLAGWLAFYHRQPDAISPQGRLRVFAQASAKAGREGRVLVPTQPVVAVLPGADVPAGVRFQQVTARPLASHPASPAVVVALDVLAEDWSRGPWLLGSGSVTTSGPSPVSQVDPFGSGL